MSLLQPVSTALLSYGMSGEVFHAPLLAAHAGFNLVKICERKSMRSQRRYPNVTIVNTIDDILADSAIELIIVNTPNETHFSHASMALKAGKHVVVEKPFTVTVSEAQTLIALAKEKNLMLSVFQNRRWDGDFLTVQNVVTGGMLGRIVEFEAHYDRYRPMADLTTWKETAHAGSGILYNLGSHMIDQALVLFGMPQSVSARMGIQRDGGEVEDYYDISMNYPNNFNVIVKSSYLVKEPGPRYILHGVKGSFVKYGLDPQEQALKDGHLPGGAGWGEEPSSEWGKLNVEVAGLHIEGRVRTIAGNYSHFYDNVYGVIRRGEVLAVKPEESLNVVRIIEATCQSNAKQEIIKM